MLHTDCYINLWNVVFTVILCLYDYGMVGYIQILKQTTTERLCQSQEKILEYPLLGSQSNQDLVELFRNMLSSLSFLHCPLNVDISRYQPPSQMDPMKIFYNCNLANFHISLWTFKHFQGCPAHCLQTNQMHLCIKGKDSFIFINFRMGYV